ncbi:ty3-gypsy retrotransposon protein [Cucumis melo var. makuwa]|uniref:Ty3-gypsy retrotransposon protein n=1 Tax=Cucumis melo var. makuwa TaxID=1194695 RepID=A0A5A7V976_CUCMM|nr:ty3-gypsy retrotransposon protein [Cucumis melo var. makuwa]
MKVPTKSSASPSSSASQRQRTAVRGRPISDSPLCLTNQSTTDRLYLQSCILLWANRRLCQFPSPPYATQCSLEESIRSEYRYWNKTWNYLSFLEGVRELTIESLGFTTGLIGDNSPLLGWIRLDADLNEILATSQTDMCILRDHETDMCILQDHEIAMCKVWRGADRRGARRMREGHIDASGSLYASADHNILELLGT